ncbi:hypothetical protein LF1_51890 [Rubripirellula obstinata]|uniref:Addiction module component n=1 Tax=Rubripirellula obstinata TaxID=406547 RepID=A0A5B1CQD9_9BACT|nr:hypothetical protein [Rubripirellula obstinata]KAA1256934.1 hypothetical protein LF1_57680 [Rubripirellula obstinata]KAA1257023.1 hypothetical protein LF1_56610 [Rubripirellula obstinata]KAA1262622.1 hypothetical protein LF1_51890 [Rubripirellula obstinata]
MTFAELLPDIRLLPATDRLRLIQILANELADEQCSKRQLLPESAEIWSPYDSHSAAGVLSNMLDDTSTPK